MDEFTHSALFDVIVSKDLNGNYDGYIAVGTVINEIEATSEKEVKGIVIKYDLNGNVIWKKLHEDKETYLMTIAENYNDNGIFNGYIIGGKIFEESTAEDTCDLKNYILKYTYNESKINTNVSKGGSLTIDNTALPGEVVKINVTADEGYVIEKITVLDNSGKEVEIKDNSFIMPEGEVNISVSFARLTNPQTAAIGYTIVLIILIVVIGTFTVKDKKVQEIEMLDF